MPLADRLEWAVFSLLSTSGQISEAAFFDRVASMFRGHDAPDEALVRACLESYRSPTSTAESLRAGGRPARPLARARRGHRPHHRLRPSPRACAAGSAPAEQRHLYEGVPLGELLTDAERRAYLPLISRGAQEALETTDAIWYIRDKATFLFEVEWTAMLTEPLLRRGPRIPTDDTVVRFLVVAPERTELLRYKLAHSPLLRRTMEADNWHILKTDHLRTLVEGEADLDRLGATARAWTRRSIGRRAAVPLRRLRSPVA